MKFLMFEFQGCIVLKRRVWAFQHLLESSLHCPSRRTRDIFIVSKENTSYQFYQSGESLASSKHDMQCCFLLQTDVISQATSISSEHRKSPGSCFSIWEVFIAPSSESSFITAINGTVKTGQPCYWAVVTDSIQAVYTGLGLT